MMRCHLFFLLMNLGGKALNLDIVKCKRRQILGLAIQPIPVQIDQRNDIDKKLIRVGGRLEVEVELDPDIVIGGMEIMRHIRLKMVERQHVTIHLVIAIDLVIRIVAFEAKTQIGGGFRFAVVFKFFRGMKHGNFYFIMCACLLSCILQFVKFLIF